MKFEIIFIITIISPRISPLVAKLVSGSIFIFKKPNELLPKYLKISKWANGVYFNQTLFTTPQRINCVPYSIDVKNTESVFDLKTKQTNIASEM